MSGLFFLLAIVVCMEAPSMDAPPRILLAWTVVMLALIAAMTIATMGGQ